MHRVVCAIDCSKPVNPNLIRQQAEGGVGEAVMAPTAPAAAHAGSALTGPRLHDLPLRLSQAA